MATLLALESVSVFDWRGARRFRILDDVSFELGAGDFTGVYGERGAGKTTLVNVAAGWLSPDEGQVLLDGRRLDDASRQDLRGALHAQIGFADRAGPELPNMTAEEWVATAAVLDGLSWRGAIREARAALERVGQAAACTMPWRTLSNNEQMLVAIAQAVVRQPRLLIVDEPVAGLVAQQRGEIMSLLHGFANDGMAVLMAAAEMIEFQGASRIWSLYDGALSAPPTRQTATVLPFRGRGGVTSA
jgi:ABC-type multidrug transport system ATPase subunit